MEETLLVQEIAHKCNDVPSRYVLREHDRPAVTAAAAAAAIPVIDIGHLSHPDGRGDEAGRLRSALESWGLFLVTNHGIEASLMDEMMNVSREFFWQPLEAKQKYTNLIDGKHFQLEGYGNDRVRTKDQILDWNDRLYLQVEPEDERKLPLWPNHPSSFGEVLNEFNVEIKRMNGSILRAMAKLLQLSEDYFVNQLSGRVTVFSRFNYYPSCPRPDLVFGIKPHSDSTLLSVLLSDNNVGGLQVLGDGVWYDVPIVPHTLVIIAGDLTEIMSNGIFKSPVHRVVTNVQKEVISVAMFYITDPEKEIEPAAELVHENRPALYRKVKTKDYVDGLFEHFSRGARVMDTVKI